MSKGSISSHTILANIIQKVCEDEPVVYNLIRLSLVCKRWASTLVPQHFYMIKCHNFDQLLKLASKPLFNHAGARECKFTEIILPRPVKNVGCQLTNGKLAMLLDQCPTIRSLSLLSFSLENEPNFGGCMSDILKVNTNLSRLALMGVELVTNGSSTIIASLKQNNTVTELNLSRNFLKERDGILLGDIIKNNNTITKMDLSFNEFRISGLKSIIEALQHNHSIVDMNLEAVCRLDCMITGLNLSSPPLTPTSNVSNSFTQLNINSPINSNLLTFNGPSSFGAGSLGGFNNSPNSYIMGTPPLFPSSSSDIHFNPSNWVPSSPSSISMNTKLIESIVHLKSNKNLKTLNLSHNTFGKQFNHSLGDLIIQNKSITSLHLNYLKLDDECGAKVGRALKYNKSIKSLSLIYNQLGKESGFEIAFNMSCNNTITQLFLSNNLLNEEIGVEMSNMLRVNQILNTLDLSDNNIGSTGAKHILEGLRHNSTLTKFSFRNNKIGDNAGSYFASLFKENKTLTFLDISYNHFQTNAGILMAMALENNASIRQLYLSHNLMLEATNNSEANIKRCTSSILNIFTRNKTLLTLDLEGNSFPTTSIKEINNYIIKNHSNLIITTPIKKKKKGLFNRLSLSSSSN